MLTVDPLWDLVGERTGCRIKQEGFNRLIMEVGGACGSEQLVHWIGQGRTDSVCTEKVVCHCLHI